MEFEQTYMIGARMERRKGIFDEQSSQWRVQAGDLRVRQEDEPAAFAAAVVRITAAVRTR
jgi:hypothetical protein